MHQTPSSFVPLFEAQDHPDPLNFIFQGDSLLVDETGTSLPPASLLSIIGCSTEKLQALGMLSGRYCQAGWVGPDAVPPPGYAFVRLRAVLFGPMDPALSGLAGRAFQVVEWARSHQYCGACATEMERVAGERCMRCKACQRVAYPRISPAMMVLVRKGEQVLLALHTQSPSKRFTPLAGFLEAGESVEEAIHREVYEEVGLRVHNLKYFSSQSWPFPHSLMLAFTADYLDGEIRVDPNEIAEARWFGPDDAWPERIPVVSVSQALVDAHRPDGSPEDGRY